VSGIAHVLQYRYWHQLVPYSSTAALHLRCNTCIMLRTRASIAATARRAAPPRRQHRNASPPMRTPFSSLITPKTALIQDNS